MVQANDWMPTLLAAAGVTDIKEKLLAGHTAGNKTFKVHLDGYNQLPYLTGQAQCPSKIISSSDRAFAASGELTPSGGMPGRFG
jgi:arylsulfatase A-like enzyme